MKQQILNNYRFNSMCEYKIQGHVLNTQQFTVVFTFKRNGKI